MTEIRRAWLRGPQFECPWCGRRLKVGVSGGRALFAQGWRADGDVLVYRTPRRGRVTLRTGEVTDDGQLVSERGYGTTYLDLPVVVRCPNRDCGELSEVAIPPSKG